MTHRSEDGANVLVVVPPSSLASAARTHARVETLASVRARLREHLAPDLELADPIAVRLALAQVAPQVVEDDASLSRIARRGGRAWLRVLDAADDAIGATADQGEALLVVARGRDSAASRARVLWRLGRALDRALADVGLLDPRREAERVADKVAHADPADVVLALSAVELRARGIVDWSASDLALWRVLSASLSRVSGRADIELPVFDRPLDAGRERDPLDRLIDAVASAIDDAPLASPVASPIRDGARSAGVELAAQVIEVRTAMSASAQGRAVADAVHDALTAGAAPSDVVIALVSDDETSAREIVAALAGADIPASDARRSRARSSNLTAFADFVLEVAERGSPRDEVARLLRSPYVDARAVLGQDDAAAGQRLLRDLSRALSETPTASGKDVPERLARTATAWAAGRKHNAMPIAQAALRIGQSISRVADGRTRGDHVRSSRALWRDLGLDRVPSASASLGRVGPAGRIHVADLAARARDEDAWRGLGETIASYERAVARLGLADVPTSLETFRHEVAWADARRLVPTIPEIVPGGVRLVGFADLPDDASAALVVIADADASSWPSGGARAELVPEALAERLAEASDPALRPLADAGDAPAFARLALGTAGARHVVFTCVVRDEDGGARSPAAVALPFVRPHARVWGVTAGPERPLSERDWLLRTLARTPGDAQRLVPEVARRALLDTRREQVFGAELPAEHPLSATLPRGEPFTTILADETGGGSRPLAASSIDTLASCVFRGFVGDVLKPRRARQVPDVADAREAGRLSHLGLEEAFRATAPLWAARPRDAPSILRAGLAAADRVLAREQAASDLARVAIDQARAGVRAVLEWSLADETWDFALAEAAFGDEGAWEELVLSRDGVRVALRGRVDRVDVAHDSGRVRVIDYKTKERSAESHTGALGSTKFQVALYARAAEAALERAGADGLYLGIQRLRPGGSPRRHAERWAEAHELADGVPAFERRILDLVGELRRGEVAVRPYEAASCVHCDYRGVCRKPRFAPAAPVDDADAEDAR